MFPALSQDMEYLTKLYGINKKCKKGDTKKMYDFYLSKKENNYYKKGENAMFTRNF